jgi:hypothetical protein
MNDLLSLLGGHTATVPITGGSLGNLQGLLQSLIANSNGNRLQRGQPQTMLMGTNKFPVASNQVTNGFISPVGTYSAGFGPGPE